MNFGDNRAAGYAIIAAVYALAATAGILIYRALPLDFWLALLIADVAATAVVFVFSVIFKNASFYDPYWSVQPIVIVIAYAINAPVMGVAQILPITAICIWGVRLTANWAYTFRGPGHQDWRYTQLQSTTGKLYPAVNFLGIHLVPTLVVYACVLPAIYTLTNTVYANVGSVIFFCVSLLAVILQGTADIQMHAFRKSGTGGFMRGGVWKYSRHPNYLGEIIMWWGIALAAVCVMPQRWYMIAGAVANTLLFACISIPMADKRQSRKPGFDEYKAQTRMLLPIKK